MKLLNSPGVPDTEYGPDPVLLKKQGMPSESRNIEVYRQKIADEDYLNHAINRIAMELSHFIAK